MDNTRSCVFVTACVCGEVGCTWKLLLRYLVSSRTNTGIVCLGKMLEQNQGEFKANALVCINHSGKQILIKRMQQLGFMKTFKVHKTFLSDYWKKLKYFLKYPQVLSVEQSYTLKNKVPKGFFFFLVMP